MPISEYCGSRTRLGKSSFPFCFLLGISSEKRAYDVVVMLSDQSLSTFQKLYFDEYGETLTLEDARTLAERLVNLYRAVYLPKRYFNTEEVAYEETH